MARRGVEFFRVGAVRSVVPRRSSTRAVMENS